MLYVPDVHSSLVVVLDLVQLLRGASGLILCCSETLMELEEGVAVGRAVEVRPAADVEGAFLHALLPQLFFALETGHFERMLLL